MGLPKELWLHCLRHSYVAHLIEAGYDPVSLDPGRPFLRLHDWPLHMGIVGLQTEVSVKKMIAIASPPRRTKTPEQRRIGYRWNLRTLMGQRNLWKTTELMPLLKSRGINPSVAGHESVVRFEPVIVST